MDQAQRGACSKPEVHAPGPGAAGISMTSDHSLDRFAEMQINLPSADAEREREHRNGGEAGGFGQGAQSDAQIGEHEE